MDVQPGDLVALVAVVMGISVVLVPVIGFTARYVLRPFETALARYMEGRASDDTLRIMERRLALMEQQIETMEGALERIGEAADFHRELRAPAAPHAPALPAPPNDVRS